MTRVDKVDIAKHVAAQLFQAEEAVDVALLQTARLITDMLVARRDLKLCASIGQGALDQAAGAITALTQARGDLVATHEALAETRDRMGMRAVALGALDKPDHIDVVLRADAPRVRGTPSPIARLK
jgi:hypothetical protein